MIKWMTSRKTAWRNFWFMQRFVNYSRRVTVLVSGIAKDTVLPLGADTLVTQIMARAAEIHQDHRPCTDEVHADRLEVLHNQAKDLMRLERILNEQPQPNIKPGE